MLRASGDHDNCLFIDFEAFQHGDEDFIIKELCVLDVRAPTQPLYFLFKPPTQWCKLSREQRRTYSYQERHLHHISWNAGEQHYCPNCIQRYIKKKLPSATAEQSSSSPPIFYTVGAQKAAFLAKEFSDLNISMYDCSSYKDLPHAPTHIVCMNYRCHLVEHCALLKCYRMYHHYLNRYW